MKKIVLMLSILALTSTTIVYAQNKADGALNQVLTAYYGIKNALANDNKVLAIEKTRLFTTKINAIPHNELNAAAHKIWMEQAAILKSKSVQLVGSQNIKTQKKAFEGISAAMIKVVEGLKFNQKTAYVQYCPMEKASWVSDKLIIENPYFGSEMLDCGKVTATLKAKG